MSLDNLRTLSWVVPTVLLLAAGLVSWRTLHWSAVGSVLLFAALNVAAGIYILNHLGDPRWSAGGEPPLSAPSFSETPMVGQFLEPLDAALNAVVGQVNAFLAFQQGLSVAMEFLAISGWALLAAFPLALLAVIISYINAQRRAADFKKYRATVDLLQEELAELKRQISAGNFVPAALPAGNQVRDARAEPQGVTPPGA
ncbi:hypothetical protein [Zafaria cholistanensis]|uniref:hypothetical protein n=1 Tax=Zafaria cholistanensis TaxID=1682741 RepID=UPI0012306FE3|nr:hypothetical protein [Zafaria cholistanensis]